MSCLDNVEGDWITSRQLWFPLPDQKLCNWFYLCGTVYNNVHICNHHSEDDLKKNIYDDVSSVSPAKRWCTMSNISVKCDVSESQQNHFFYLLYILNVTQWTEAHAHGLTAHRNSGCGCAACHNANGPRNDKWNLSDKIKTPHISSTIQEIYSHIPNSLFHTQSYLNTTDIFTHPANSTYTPLESTAMALAWKECKSATF